MKKIVLILGLCLVFNMPAQADDNNNKQEFVNPIFNQPLLAYGRTSRNTILTLNSIAESLDDFSVPEAHIEKHSCKLLKNEAYYIKFLCNICYQDILIINKINCSTQIVIYQITDDGFIEKQSFRLHEQEPFSIEHLITKP